MFYVAALLQVLIYLFVMPSIGLVLDADSPHGVVSLSIAALFAAGFFVGHGVSFGTARRKAPLHIDAFTRVGSIVITVWCAIHITLCFEYGLHDRRIGTDSIALLLSGLSVYELIVIRTLEVFFPYLIAISFFAYWTTRTNIALLPLLALMAAFLSSGAINSRSQVIILGLSALIMLQNVLSPHDIRRLLKVLVVLGAAVVSVVTLVRLSQELDVDAGNYARDEFVKRLDGLEVTSKLIQGSGVKPLGTDPQSLLSPIFSVIPVSDRTTELKELALTTIKANILQNEFSSNERDINSFVITDAYYAGGLIGVLVVGWGFGALTRAVDSRIGATRTRCVHLLLVAAVCNGLALERETTGILIGTLRDWLLLVVLMAVLCKWRRLPSRRFLRVKAAHRPRNDGELSSTQAGAVN
jgi:fumarate reductase subunit D